MDVWVMGFLGGCRVWGKCLQCLHFVGSKSGVNVWGAVGFVRGLWGVSGGGDKGGLWASQIKGLSIGLQCLLM